MIGRLSHVAIATPDLEQAASIYRDVLGADVSASVDLPAFGVTTVFVKLPNTDVELLHPLGDKSPIASFLARHPGGGLHHLCFEVADIDHAVAVLQSRGMRLLDPQPRPGAHGHPVVFLHPKDMAGVLIELVQMG
ncbi:MAG: methylmalonyl-CoA epimerase [Magnetococcales bacterium]|nr:methylmalonyl-CoA epimerase [Magnetococcales bacterium]